MFARFCVPLLVALALKPFAQAQPSNASDPNSFSVPTDVPLPAGVPSTSLRYGASNLQVELFALTENKTHVNLIIQLAVANASVCGASLLYGAPGPLREDGTAGCAGSALGVALYAEPSGFGAGLQPAANARITGIGGSPKKFGSKGSALVAALQVVQDNSVARFAFAIPKALPAVLRLLPRNSSAAAAKPIRVMAWSKDFRTYRQLSSAPGSGILDAIGKANLKQQGQPGSSNIRTQYTVQELRTPTPMTKLTMTVANTNPFGSDLARPLHMRILLAKSTKSTLVQKPKYGLLLNATAAQPYVTFTAIPTPLNSFSFELTLPPGQSIGDFCQQGVLPTQPNNTCCVVLSTGNGTSWVQFAPAAGPSDPAAAAVLTESLVVRPETVDTPLKALQVAQTLNTVIQRGDNVTVASVYKAYKVNMGKVYASLEQERQVFVTFNSNLRFVADHNLQLDVNTEYRRRRGRALLKGMDAVTQPTTTFWVGINSYSDVNQTQYASEVLMPSVTPPVYSSNLTTGRTTIRFLPPRPPPRPPKAPSSPTPYRRSVLQALPLDLDWRDTLGEQRFPLAKNQFRCASAWANAAMAALEASLLLAYPNVPRSEAVLSRQQVIDCARPEYGGTNYTSHGCGGGWPLDVFTFAYQQGLVRERDYGYNGTALNFTCKDGALLNRSSSSIYRDVVVAGEPGAVVAYEGSSAKQLMEALQHGPLVVLMDGSDDTFKQYSGGIYTSDTCSSRALTHALLLVGYHNNGSSTEPDGYWIVRNSLGYQWGNMGDGKIRMTPEGTKGMCGMYRFAFAPPRTFSVVPRSYTTSPPPIFPPAPPTPPPSPPAPPHDPYTTICLGGTRSDWCLQVCLPSEPSCANFVNQSGGALLTMWAPAGGVPLSRTAFYRTRWKQASGGIEAYTYQHVASGRCLTVLSKLGFWTQTTRVVQMAWPIALTPCVEDGSGANVFSQLFVERAFPMGSGTILYSFINSNDRNGTFNGNLGDLGRCLDGCSDSNILQDRAAAGYTTCNRFTPDSYDNSHYSAAYVSRCWASGEEDVPYTWLDFELLSLGNSSAGYVESARQQAT